MILVLIECDLKRVKHETDGSLFKTVERDKLVLELLSKNLFGGVKGCTHSDLEGASPDDSSAFEAGVLACWLDHFNHMRGFRIWPT